MIKLGELLKIIDTVDADPDDWESEYYIDIAIEGPFIPSDDEERAVYLD